MEPGAVLQMDNFYWKHPTKEVHVKGTLLVDASSRAAVVQICELHPVRNFLEMCQRQKRDKCYKNRGSSFTDVGNSHDRPEGCFRERLFREWLASKNVKWDPQPAEAAWRIGILEQSA